MKYDLATRERMTALVREWDGSAETQGAFMERHGLTVAQFRYWRRTARPAGESVKLAPVRVVDGSSDTVIEFAASNGLRVMVRAGAAAPLVEAIVRALQQGC